MGLKLFSLENDIKNLHKFDKLDNLIFIIINGAALLFSVLNAYSIEKDFTKLGTEIGSLIIYLISSLFIYKQKDSITPKLYRILCLSTLTLIIVIDIKSFHSFHVLFLFFLSLNFKKYLEILFYPILCFIIFIVKLETSLFDKFTISLFSIFSLVILILALTERRGKKVKKEIMIMNEATKLAALTEMSNGVAHEINNPLTIIAGIIQIMEMKMESDKLKDNDLKNLLETVSAATERASHVVRSLEEFSRDGSKDPLQIISLKTLCLDSIDIFKERCKKLDI
ncbi:MAG: histidine kinase dimerization/phospho-acceptor domain-containing protein, partial [Bdellovibrionota bacterium]|nr:histidine kinase dimerization/phospho-acceptor domain-containing protein [Bdellovibrionota bacterium]